MKIITLFKTTFVIILFLTTTILFAQDSIKMQDSIKIIEPLPNNSEKLNLILPKVYWFNKYKIILENYGVANIKEGITSTTTNRKKGITYSEIKQKNSIKLTDSDNNSSTLEFKTIQNDEYVIKENILLNRVLDVGVESEEIESIVIFPKSISGSITTNLDNSKIWEINLKVIDQKSFLFVEIGRLTVGERTINVIRTNLDSNKNINTNGDISERTIFYEFLENGVSLGAMTCDFINSFWLKPELDPETKLILCTVMLSIGY